MRKLVFPDLILSHFLIGWRCDQCRNPAHAVVLRRPYVKVIGDRIHLTYPVRCRCGRWTPLRIELPRLVFGYIVGQVAYLEALRSRSTIELMLTAHGCEWLERMLQEFEKDAREFLGERAEPPHSRFDNGRPGRPNLHSRPMSHERIDFRMSDEEWKSFLNRLGFGMEEDSGEGKEDIPF